MPTYNKNWARKTLADYPDSPTHKSACIEFLREACDFHEIDGRDIFYVKNFELMKKSREFHKKARGLFAKPSLEARAKVPF